MSGENGVFLDFIPVIRSHPVILVSFQYSESIGFASDDVGMRSDFRLNLTTFPFIENSPALFSPCLKDIPSPVSLVFTPVVPEKLSCSNCDAEMTLNHQCDCEAIESDSSFKLASSLTLPPDLEKSKPRPSPSAPVVLKKPVRMLDGSPAFPPRQKGKNN